MTVRDHGFGVSMIMSNGGRIGRAPLLMITGVDDAGRHGA